MAIANFRDLRVAEEAQALWEACPSVKPAWSQLGEVTRRVWEDKARAGLTPDAYRDPTEAEAAPLRPRGTEGAG